MGYQRKYLFKYISILNYVLKSCFNQIKAQAILKTLLHDLKTKILLGSEIPFKCLPDNILEKLITQCYNNKLIQKQNLQIHKCIFVSPEVLNKLNLNNFQWVFVNVLTKNSSSLPVLHYNKIVVLDSFKRSECLLTSTNLFNICNCDHTCQVLMLRIVKPMIDNEQKITKKASISVINPLVFNEDTQTILDKVLNNYFSLPKFVSVGDIFKLDLNKCYPEVDYLIKPSKMSYVYIKIVELEGKNVQINVYNCKKNFCISNLCTTLNQVDSLTNTYLPMEKEFAINNLKNLDVNNYNDFILNVIPGGMNDDGDILVSWIKPFIYQRHTGDFIFSIIM